MGPLIQNIYGQKPRVSIPIPNLKAFGLWESNEDDVYEAKELVYLLRPVTMTCGGKMKKKIPRKITTKRQSNTLRDSDDIKLGGPQ